jgi:hypothetical protein
MFKYNILLCDVAEFEDCRYPLIDSILRLTQRKKSNSVRSSKLGGHTRKLPLPVHLFIECSFKNCWTVFPKCWGSQSCLNHAPQATVALYSVLICPGMNVYRWSQWPHGLRHELSLLALTQELWVRIPVKAWMSVCAFILCLCYAVCR